MTHESTPFIFLKGKILVVRATCCKEKKGGIEKLGRLQPENILLWPSCKRRNFNKVNTITIKYGVHGGTCYPRNLEDRAEEGSRIITEICNLNSNWLVSL